MTPANPAPMRPLNALLLDESAAARESLRRMLLRHPAICVRGECASPGEVGRMEVPDLIFTDSTFREGSLSEVCGGFPSGAQMVIISADRTFAWQAFELDAVDFLVKPVEPKRLAEAVRRLLRLDWRPGSRTMAPPADVVIIPFERGRRGVALKEICAIQAFGNYTRVMLADGSSELVLRSLNRWQQALPASSFLRVHRNAVVNRDRVRSLENNGEADSALLQVEGMAESVVVSRRQASALKKLLFVKIP